MHGHDVTYRVRVEVGRVACVGREVVVDADERLTLIKRVSTVRVGHGRRNDRAGGVLEGDSGVCDRAGRGAVGGIERSANREGRIDIS